MINKKYEDNNFSLHKIMNCCTNSSFVRAALHVRYLKRIYALNESKCALMRDELTSAMCEHIDDMQKSATLSKLSDSMFRKFFFEKSSIEEIAEENNIKVVTVHTNLKRTLKSVYVLSLVCSDANENYCSQFSTLKKARESDYLKRHYEKLLNMSNDKM